MLALTTFNALKAKEARAFMGLREDFGASKVCKACKHPTSEHSTDDGCSHKGCKCMDMTEDAKGQETTCKECGKALEGIQRQSYGPTLCPECASKQRKANNAKRKGLKEEALCAYCNSKPVDPKHDPYCSTECAINAQNDDDLDESITVDNKTNIPLTSKSKDIKIHDKTQDEDTMVDECSAKDVINAMKTEGTGGSGLKAIMDTSVPAGQPGPMHFNCKCGTEVPVKYPDGPDVTCTKCGQKYDSRGWLQEDVQKLAPGQTPAPSIIPTFAMRPTPNHHDSYDQRVANQDWLIGQYTGKPWGTPEMLANLEREKASLSREFSTHAPYKAPANDPFESRIVELEHTGRAYLKLLNESFIYCPICMKPVMNDNDEVGDVVVIKTQTATGRPGKHTLYHSQCATQAGLHEARNWRTAVIPERKWVASIYYKDERVPLTTTVYGNNATEAEDVAKFEANNGLRGFVDHIVVHQEVREQVEYLSELKMTDYLVSYLDDEGDEKEERISASSAGEARAKVKKFAKEVVDVQTLGADD